KFATLQLLSTSENCLRIRQPRTGRRQLIRLWDRTEDARCRTPSPAVLPKSGKGTPGMAMPFRLGSSSGQALSFIPGRVLSRCPAVALQAPRGLDPDTGRLDSLQPDGEVPVVAEVRHQLPSADDPHAGQRLLQRADSGIRHVSSHESKVLKAVQSPEVI